MNKPLLIVVTGRPASGKTTLAHLLAKKINCPLLSRDELKEGYINTVDVEHNKLSNSADQHIYNTFFEAIDLLIAKGISIIVEAAFQDKLWKPKLPDLSLKAEIKIIICTTNLKLVQMRFAERLANNPGREKFHGDQSINAVKEQHELMSDKYQPVHFNAPTLQVDTTENYNPDIEAIVHFIKTK